MKTKKYDYIGQIFTTNEGYKIKIIDYISKSKVMVQFIDYKDYYLWCTMQNIKNGQIKNPYHKSVYGIGYYGVGNYSSRINNIKTEQYIKWFSMFNRCYSEDYHKKQPSYIGCSVSEPFHNFQNFARWYDEKIYKCSYPLELDKDLLYEGNKIYSPSTCCFLPKEVNNAITNKKNDKKYMNRIYNKYKDEVPSYIKEKLFFYTQ